MAPRWKRIAAPPPVEGRIYLETVLRPHRSLSPKGFRLLLTALIGMNVAVAAVFVSRGAYPVAGFLGLDVAALWLAFRVNYRAARAEERIRVTPLQMLVERRAANGASTHFLLNPIWARVENAEAGVMVWSGGKALRVGAFLAEEERAAFAGELDAALYRAKRGV